MSTEVERKVVDMQFNNRQFERNINTSISSLDKLKESLNFNGMGKGLEEVDRAASSVNFSGLTKGVDEVTAKFSYMQVAIATVVQNITNDITNAVKGWTQQLTTANINAGWDKYAEKTSAVQTIMAATSKDFANQAEQMEVVTKQLERLNWFADETSYSLIDMTSNVGKFTANNIPLDQSVTAMEGIAAAAALAGAGTAGASRAMYNFSQALGTGAVKVQDWMSIENANMATAEFKETIMDTAAEEGNLVKKGDKYYINTKKLAEATGQSEAQLKTYIAGMEGVSETAEGIEVSVENFRTTLAEGWFDSNVLNKALSKYGAFSDEISKMYEYVSDSPLSDFTTSELVAEIDKYREAIKKTGSGQKVLDDLVAKTGLDAETLGGYLNKLSSDEYDLGRRAFKAAQEAKTFREAIDSIKDAASTKWSSIFENIFGNYLEAKTVWTNLANYLYDLFVGPVDELVDVFKQWKNTTTGIIEVTEDGAEHAVTYQELLMKAFGNIGKAIEVIKDAIVKAFDNVFGSLDKTALMNFTDKFFKLTESMILSEDAADRLTRTLTKILTVIKRVWKVVKTVVNAVWRVVSFVAPYIYDLVISIADGIDYLSDRIKGLSNESGFTDFLQNVKETADTKLAKIVTKIAEAFGILGEKLIDFADSINWDVVANKIWNALTKIGSAIEKLYYAIKPLVTHLYDFLVWAVDKISKKIQEFRDKVNNTEISEEAKKLWENLKVVFNGIMKIANVFLENLAKFVGSDQFDNLLDLIRTIAAVSVARWLTRGGPLGDIVDAFEYIGSKFATAAKLKAVKNFGEGLLMIVGSMFILSTLDKDSVAWASRVLVDWVMNISAAMIIMGLLGGGKLKIGTASTFVTMGVLLGAMASVMAIVGSWDEAFMENAYNNMSRCIELLYAMVLAVGAFALMTKRSKKDRGFFGATVSLFAIIGAFSLFIKAIDMIYGMPESELDKGIDIFQSLLLTVGTFMLMLSNKKTAGAFGKASFSGEQSTPIIEAAFGIVLISGSMWLLAQAFKELNGISLDNVSGGVKAFAALMIVFGVVGSLLSNKQKNIGGALGIDGILGVSNSGMTGFKDVKAAATASTSKSAPIIDLAVGVVAIAGAMWIFSKALENLAWFDGRSYLAAVLIMITAIGGVLLTTLALNKIYSKSGTTTADKYANIIPTFLAVAILAGAVWVFAKAMQELDKVTNNETIWQGILIMTVMIGGVLAIGLAMSELASSGAGFFKLLGIAVAMSVGLAALVGAMYLFGLAVESLYGITPGQIAAGLVIIAGLGLIGAGLSWLFTKIAWDGVAKALVGLLAVTLILPLIAGGMWLLFKVMDQAPDLSDGQFKSSLLAIIGVLAALVGVFLVMKTMSVSFEAIGKLIDGVFKIILYVAGAVALLTWSIVKLSALSEEDVDNFLNNMKKLAEGLPKIWGIFRKEVPSIVANFLNALVEGIEMAIPDVVLALNSLLRKLLEATKDTLWLFFDVIIAVLDMIHGRWDEIALRIVILWNDLVGLLTNMIPGLVKLITSIITAVLIGIDDNILIWAKSIESILGKLFHELGVWFDNPDNTSELTSAVGNLGSIIGSTIKIAGSETVSALNAVSGALDNVVFQFEKVTNAGGAFSAFLIDIKQLFLELGILVTGFDTKVKQIFGKNWFGYKIARKNFDLLVDEYSDIYTDTDPYTETIVDKVNAYNDALKRYEHLSPSSGAIGSKAIEDFEKQKKIIEKLTDEEIEAITKYRDTLSRGIRNGGILGDAAKEAQEQIDAINKVLGIHSPSTVFEQIGKYCVEGLDKGIKETEGKPIETTKSISDTIQDIWNGLGEDEDVQVAIDFVVNSDAANKVKSFMADNFGDFSVKANPVLSSDLATSTGKSFNANKYVPTNLNPITTNNSNDSYISNTFNIQSNDANSIAQKVVGVIQTQLNKRESVWKTVTN